MYSKIDSQKRRMNFIFLMANSGISRFGFSSFNLIIIWIVLYITHSPFLSGLADGTLSFPLFISFFVGALVDKILRKKMLAIGASVLRSFSIFSIFYGLIISNELIILISIYLSAFAIGLTSDLLNSIRASWMKEFLSEDQYKKGTSSENSIYSLAEGTGYILSGFILGLGFIGAFAAIMIVFIVSILPLLLIKAEESKIPVNTGMGGVVKEGFEFIKSTPIIVEIMAMAFISNLIFGMSGIIFIVLVQLHYMLPSYYVSLIFGVLIISIVAGSLIGRKVRGRLGLISVLTFIIIGISLLSIYFIDNIFLVIPPSITIGLAIGILNVAFGTAVLKEVPQNMMARIQGAFSTFSIAVVSFSGMIGGILIQVVGYSKGFLVLGVAIIAVSPLFLLMREINKTIV